MRDLGTFLVFVVLLLSQPGCIRLFGASPEAGCESTDDCPAGQVCEPGGSCVPEAPCEPECATMGATACRDARAREICADLDGDGCLEWSPQEPCEVTMGCVDGLCLEICGEVVCPPGERCAGEECVEDDECLDECEAVDHAECLGETSLRLCGESDGDPCLEWIGPFDCMVGAFCEDGECREACPAECGAVGARTCSTEGSRVLECVEIEGCLQWIESEDCGPDGHCDVDRCETGCEDACIPGELRCAEETVAERCEDSDADGCFEWIASAPCSVDGFCVDGFCVSFCPTPCLEPESRRCLDGTHLSICEWIAVGDCANWSEPVACPAGQACAEGQCVPECLMLCDVLGDRLCLDDGSFVTCVDRGGCLQWSEPVSCGADEICAEGLCIAVCPDPCPEAGARSCRDGRFVLECADLGPCLDWTIAMDCAPAATCEVDTCVSL